MLHLADLLASIPLPPLPEELPAPPVDPAALRRDLEACCGDDASLVHDLGADLPAGHLHVWGGPSGAGKTAFLLCLLQSAAARGRRVVYATYELAPERLALRLLARTAGVDVRTLPDPGSDPEAAAPDAFDAETLMRLHTARARLAALPFDVLSARGFSARSLTDRLVRMPFRAEVLAVDYLQAVVRVPGEPMGAALKELSFLADHLHVAVVCAVAAPDTAGGGLEHPELEEIGTARGVDRVGWLTPAARDAEAQSAEARSAEASSAEGSSAEQRAARALEAQVLRNRHGDAPTVPLHLDGPTGSFERA